MVACKAPYNFANMTTLELERVLTSGPARFQRLSAYHPSITSRYVENLGSTLPTTYPRNFFNNFCNLEVFSAYISNFIPFNQDLQAPLKMMVKFCSALSNIYQVITVFLILVYIYFLSIEFFTFIVSICPYCPFVFFVHLSNWHFPTKIFLK